MGLVIKGATPSTLIACYLTRRGSPVGNIPSRTNAITKPNSFALIFNKPLYIPKTCEPIMQFKIICLLRIFYKKVKFCYAIQLTHI